MEYHMRRALAVAVALVLVGCTEIRESQVVAGQIACVNYGGAVIHREANLGRFSVLCYDRTIIHGVVK